MRFKKNVRMTLLYLAFIVIGVAMVFPFIWMIATSFKTGTDIYSLSLLPKKFTLENYREVLSGSDFPRWFLNSFLVAGITTLSVLVFDPLLGYAFCKYRFRGKEAIFTMLLSTMMIPTEMMIIPWYMMVNQLGWNNTYWSMLFPGLSSAFGIFLMRQFFRGMPKELEEAAYVDGAGPLKTFIKIMLPGAVAMMVTVFLFSFVWQWLDTSYTTVFCKNIDLISTRFSDLSNSWVTDPSASTSAGASTALSTSLVKNAGIVIIIAPLIVLYAFTQRFFVESISRSGLVG